MRYLKIVECVVIASLCCFLYAGTSTGQTIESGWRTVSGAVADFSVEYPANDWTPKLVSSKFSESGQLLEEHSQLVSNSRAVVSIDIERVVESLSIRKWLDLNAARFDVQADKVKETTVSAQALPALGFSYHSESGQSYDAEYVVFMHDSFIFRISYLKADQGASQSVFDHVLASFNPTRAAENTFSISEPGIGETPILVYSCGSHNDDCLCGSSNPYPCCSNGGNCTWWAWDRACCNWDVALPSPWRDAKYWADDLQSNGYYVSSTPAANTIACRDIGTWGHVAYVQSVSGNNVTVSEMGCDGWYNDRVTTYDASYFTGGYISQTPLDWAAPNLSSPANGVEFFKGVSTITFSWSAVSGAPGYEIWIDNNSGFGSPEIGYDNGLGDPWLNNGVVYTTSFNLTTSWQNQLAQNVYFWKVKVLGASDSDFSSARQFSLLDPTITVISPNGGETIPMGQPYTIRWQTTGSISNLYVHLYRYGIEEPNMVVVLHGGAPNTGSLVWDVQCDLDPGPGYYMGLSKNPGGDPWDFSDGPFTITEGTPGSTSLSSPAAGTSICSGQSQNFCWNTVSGAASYRIEWDDNSGFSSPDYQTTTSTCLSRTLSGSGTWYWRVRAVNNCGNGSWSTSRTVQLLSTPATVSLSSPATGASLCSGQSQSYCWNTVSGATNYRIEWDDNSGFSSPVYENTSSTCFSKTLTGSGTWYWRARADNACGSGSWSSSRTVQLLSVPSAVTLASPADGYTVSLGASQQFCWNAVSGATSYIIQWDDNSGFSSPTQLTNSSTCVNQSFTTAGTWYWRAQAGNSCGSGSWSSSRTIVVESPALDIPALTSPANGLEFCSGESINYCWNTVSEATLYRIQWANNAGFTSPQESTTSDLCIEHEITTGGMWYWRARAEDGATYSDWSSARTIIVSGSPSVVLVAPNGGESYIQGSTHEICWTFTGCDPTSFSLLLSTDCGLSYTETLDEDIDPSESCWTWSNVQPVSNQLKVKIIAYGSSGDVMDESNACFSIEPPAGCIPVSIADFEGNAGETVQIPVICEDVTGENITAFEIVLHFDPDSMQIAVPAYSITGCLIESGWTILSNPDNTNGMLTVGGFGVSALAGGGCLFRIAAQIPANAAPATCSPLDIESFVFNEGLPCAALQSGSLCARATVGVSGCVHYYSGGLPLAELEIGITDGVTSTTDGSGCYVFSDLAVNTDYTMTPNTCFTELTPGSAISFYDASLAAQNAIGLITLDELQEMAADVSCNNDVSFFDASLIAQFAIDLIDAWPSECDCRTMIFNPSERIYDPLTEDQFNQDFIGIFMGDVSGNWSPSSLLSMPPSSIMLLEEDNTQPNSVTMQNLSSSDAYSFEMEISFDQHELQFTGLELLGNARQWQPFISEREGVLRIGAFGTVAVPVSEDLLRLNFSSPSSASVAAEIDVEKFIINESYHASASRTIISQVAPQTCVLNQNYPNPFNASTAITYLIPERAFVSLIVFNNLGEVITTLVDQIQNPGQHEVRFEANDLPTGLYFCELKTGDVRLVRKMMMIK